jgi:ABC-type glycerol-3-phosphate transport system permease component
MNKVVWVVARYALATVLAVVLLVPLVWAISGSFHTNAGLFGQPYDWWPARPAPGNYPAAFSAISFGQELLNSFIVGVVISTVGVFLGLMAGYALAKRRFFGRDALFWTIVATLMIPFPSIMVGVFILAKTMGITDSYAGLIIPGLLTGQIVFFMRQYLQGIPDELIEAGRIDGASEWRVFRAIVLPLSWPVMVSMGILTFVASWNNLLWPLIVVQSQSLYTVPLGLTQFSSQYFTNYVAILAMSVVAIIPVVVLFLFTRRRLLDSIMVSGGALKG